mgnify:FL=1|jgi:hypothetical protein
MASVNELNFNQVSTLLTSIVKQATGQSVLAPTNTSDFVSVATTALKNGVDPVMSAITQMVARTIFSIRPYSEKFKGLRVSSERWGNIVRKLNIADGAYIDDTSFALPDDGQSVDMYKLRRPNILQTNFYGANVFSIERSYFREQLECAFTSPEEFSSFYSMVTGNIMDMIETAHENLKRATLSNLIGGIVSGGGDEQKVHLLTEYNAKTGGEYTAVTIMAPDVYPDFMKFVYARIATVSALLTERLQLHHINVTGKDITRHTPYENQRLYMYAPAMYESTARAIADTYHDTFLRYADHETVNFWQAVETPDTIKVTPSYLKADGTITTPSDAVSVPKVFALLCDEESCGMTVCNEWSATSPLNISGGYYNVAWHFTDRFWNDFTENAVVFTMD